MMVTDVEHHQRFGLDAGNSYFCSHKRMGHGPTITK